jgi:NAD(P)-dependent dehydrogenase (short-subunit alcohol dehydrogenase family)
MFPAGRTSEVRSSREKSLMFMSVVALKPGVSVYPELAGARVLITGLSSAAGVDVARAFADQQARLVLQSGEQSPQLTELAAFLAESAPEIKLFNDPISDAEDAVRIAQVAAQDFGGLDAVINLVTLEPGEVTPDASFTDIEAAVSAKLIAAALVTRVAANRMRLTWTEGTILNVVTTAGAGGRSEAALAEVIHATLSAMTRGEAKEWAEHGVRINAVGPRAEDGEVAAASDADIAALALYLASKKGAGLSGHMFDARGLARRRCGL